MQYSIINCSSCWKLHSHDLFVTGNLYLWAPSLYPSPTSIAGNYLSNFCINVSFLPFPSKADFGQMACLSPSWKVPTEKNPWRHAANGPDLPKWLKTPSSLFWALNPNALSKVTIQSEANDEFLSLLKVNFFQSFQLDQFLHFATQTWVGTGSILQADQSRLYMLSLPGNPLHFLSLTMGLGPFSSPSFPPGAEAPLTSLMML